MRQATPWAVFAMSASVVSHAATPPPEILVPGTKLYTESITSTADRTVIIGAMGPGAIFRAQPGAASAEVWIKPKTDGLSNVLGVFADEKSSTL